MRPLCHSLPDTGIGAGLKESRLSDLVERGIEATRAGDKLTGRGLLVRAVLANPRDADAWLWLSGAVDTNEERLACLTNVLEIDPSHLAARRGADALRRQGVGLPESAVGARVTGCAADAGQPPTEVEGALARFAGLDHTRAFAQLEPRRRHALKGFSRLVAEQLDQGKKRVQVIDELVVRGFPRAAVEELVEEIARPLNRRNLKRYRRQLLRGGLTALVCLTVTVVASLVGGQFGAFGAFYYVLYGALLLGVVDFVGGLTGWLLHRV